MERFTSAAEFVLLLSALGGAVLGWVKIVRPWARKRTAEREAINEVLIGRPPVPANPITGDPAQPAKPAIGQQVADMAIVLNEVHHELHPNGGSSMKDALGRTESGVAALRSELEQIRQRLADGDRRFDDQADRLERIEVVLNDELRVATDTVANAAVASKAALEVIQLAQMSEPPADLD